VDDAGYADIMKKAGEPEPVVPFLVAIQQDTRKGTLEIESNDFAKLLGRPVTPISEALRTMVTDIQM
jgi:NAD(P)H dehydrogenase (quinone)